MGVHRIKPVVDLAAVDRAAIAERILEVSGDDTVTRLAFARAAGISMSALYNYLAAVRIPKPRQLLRIAFVGER